MSIMMTIKMHINPRGAMKTRKLRSERDFLKPERSANLIHARIRGLIWILMIRCSDDTWFYHLWTTRRGVSFHSLIITHFIKAIKTFPVSSKRSNVCDVRSQSSHQFGVAKRVNRQGGRAVDGNAILRECLYYYVTIKFLVCRSWCSAAEKWGGKFLPVMLRGTLFSTEGLLYVYADSN
jgi:hypothetical protein